MVLPPSVADDAPGPDVPLWLRRLKVILELSRAGVLVLVDHAHPERLGDLVRALLPEHPELEVYSDARQLAQAPPSSMVVLVPRAEDADWLNINRPLFAVNKLRAVLFSSRATTEVLAQRAVDFFDWISHRLECPPGPAPFAVAGLRRALAIRTPGIVWEGGDLEAAFREARPRRRLRKVSAAQPYEALVAEVRSAKGDWIAWTEVEGEFRLRRVRWALAEARRRARTILLEPAVPGLGWWGVHGRLMDFQAAREQLEHVGMRHPGRLVALLNLEEEAIELLGALARSGQSEESLEAEMRRGVDEGANIGRLAAVHGFVSRDELTRGRPACPKMRAFSQDAEASHRLQAQEDPTLVWLRYEPRTGETWAVLASAALRAGDLHVAHLWAQRAVELDPGKWKVLVQVLIQQARWAEAEKHLQQRRLLDDRSQRSGVLYELAQVLLHQGKYSEAEVLLREVIGLEKSSVGETHPNYAASIHALAGVLERQGRYAESEELVRQALALQAKALGETHPNYTVSLQGLAWILGQQGRYAEAETVLGKVLALQAMTLGEAHPYYAASLLELARVLARRGQHAEAEKVLRQVLAIQEKVLGAQHPAYAVSLGSLAQILEQQGRYAEAEELMHQGLVLQGKILDKEHPDYAGSLLTLSRFMERRGQYSEAEAQVRKVLAIQGKALSEAHPYYATSLRELARLQGKQGRYAEEEALLRQAISLQEKALGSAHPDLCASLTLLGLNLIQQQRSQEAEGVLRRSVETAHRTWGLDHPVTAMALLRLAQAEAALKKPAAAETARQAKESILNSFGPEHPVTKEVIPQLDLILEERG